MAAIAPATIGSGAEKAQQQPADASCRRPSLAPLRMCGFEPRPFPPPELADVPRAYVDEQLRRMAHAYWGKTDTADCTLIIPTKLGAPLGRGADRASRRVTEPALPAAPPLVLRLHTDYLCAHSSLLRALFGGASALDLIGATRAPAPPSAALLPRALPASAPGDARLFLPLPDPGSFRFLAHWCYFRDFRYIADYLARGLLSWAGLAQNVRYLGMSEEIKAELARYYQLHVVRDSLASPVSSAGSDADDEHPDTDTVATDSDTDSEMDMDMDVDCPKRGRPLFP